MYEHWFKRMISYIARLVPTGMVLPIVRGPLKGMKWIAGSAAGEGKGLSVVANKAEAGQLSEATKWLSKDSVCFDIGANVGLYTLLFSRFARQVYAFEPLPRNIYFLYKTLAINNIDNAVIVTAAVAEHLQQNRFLVSENCALGMLSNKGGQPVLSVSVDEFCRFHGVIPDVVKIDVEGGELDVLKGARGVLSANKPVIFLSVHSGELRRSCLSYLQELEYSDIVALNSERIDDATELLFRP